MRRPPAGRRASTSARRRAKGATRAAEAAAKGREAINQGRETLTTAIERGREAYQQARSAGAARDARGPTSSSASSRSPRWRSPIAQIGVLVAAGRLARRVERLADQFEHELKPMFGHLNAIGRDAAARRGARHRAGRAGRSAVRRPRRARRADPQQPCSTSLIGPVAGRAGHAQRLSRRRSGHPRPAPATAGPPGPRAKTKTRCSYSSSSLAPAPAGGRTPLISNVSSREGLL